MYHLCLQLKDVEVWFQRASDVVRKLKTGDVDMGIVGYDMLREYGEVRALFGFYARNVLVLRMMKCHAYLITAKLEFFVFFGGVKVSYMSCYLVTTF